MFHPTASPRRAQFATGAKSRPLEQTYLVQVVVAAQEHEREVALGAVRHGLRITSYNVCYTKLLRVLVKEGQTVARGQKIAELGDSDSDKPKLHFEIRKSGKPVDPLKYLPGDRPS